MKNTRKKMLLSSIAMLLVALIALGSATFAWYITNSTVTAETTTWNANAAEGLVIRHGTSGDWLGKLTDLAGGSNMSPASMTYANIGDDLAGASGNGTSYTDGTLSGDLSPQAIDSNTSYFVHDTFYVASSDNTTKNATFKVKGGTTEGTYLNIAVFVNGTLREVFTSDSASSGTTKKVKKVGTTLSTDTDTQAVTKLAASATVTGGTVSCTSKNTTNGAKIDVIAFVDGYNPLCKNSTYNTTAVNVTYEFSIAS